MSTRIVCFDLGGVLVRICRTWQDALDAAGISHSLGGDPAIALQSFRLFEKHQQGLIGDPELWEAMAQEFGCSGEEAQKAHRHILLEFYPGIPELLSELDFKGVPMGCLSNTNRPHWHELTISGRFEPLRLLRFRVASHIQGCAKPDPVIFRQFEILSGLKGDQVVFFDDTPENVYAAEAAGWIATWIDHSGDTAQQIRTKLIEVGILDR